MAMKFGIVGSTSKVGSSKQNNNLESKILNIQGKIIAARVIDIVLDENHKFYNSVGQWNGIGAIFYEIVNSSGTKSYPNFALPYDSQLKTYPLINEIVLLISLPNQNMGLISSSESYFYMSSLGIWNHPHHNAYPNLLDNINDKEQKQDYQSISQGNVRRVEDNSTEINLNSSNFSQNTFIEKVDIHPLMPFMGDSLLEGRYGQSIRFGSTAKSQSNKKNNWSTSGNNGDPIIIIRNGQPKKVSDEGWIPITEDIKNDLSSIYLASTQKIPFSLANENFNSYLKEKLPITPAQYNNPQIILNSNRIILNAKTDNILISGENSVGISSNSSINIESKQIYLDGTDIRLGKNDASESVLKGDLTVTYLKMIINELKCLSEALKSLQDWPGGSPVPNSIMLTVADSSLSTFEKIYNNINDIKSNFVKTI